jgi:glycerol-3-phosphate acyltransferase PlsY
LLPISLAFVALAYLIGSVSFAVVVSTALGLPDPRGYGSGNPGATNVLRTGNKLAAALTLAGDGAKGWLAVWLTALFAPPLGGGDWTIAASMLAVFLGHLYPAFHRFKGGKGVATAAGILLALKPSLVIMLALVWLVIAYGFRISSLAALCAAALAPLGAFYVLGNTPQAWAMVPIALLLFWRHRQNIHKLIGGHERTIGR